MDDDRADHEAFLTDEDLVRRYRGGVSRGTLRNWRSQGRGPPSIRVGRQVLYRLTDVLIWERTLGRPPPPKRDAG